MMEVCVDVSLQEQGEFTARQVRFSGGSKAQSDGQTIPMHVLVSLRELARALKALPLRAKGVTAQAGSHGEVNTSRACATNQTVASSLLQSSRSHHLGRPRLLLDHMLARPAKWLR